jgi:hypothetical protein
MNLFSPHRQQWSQQVSVPLAHGSGASNARAAQEIEQHGLRSVTTVVSQGNPVGADSLVGRMPRAPRRGLQAIRAFPFDIDVINSEMDTPRSACALAEIRPTIGMGAEPVVHVKCRNRSRQEANDMQKND